MVSVVLLNGGREGRRPRVARGYVPEGAGMSKNPKRQERKNFEEALADLINDYIGTESKESIVSAMELQIMALNEDDRV